MIVAVVMAVSAAAGGAPIPAQAAVPKFVVDNTGTCKNSLPSLAAGVAAAGVGPAKIVVCPGTYAESISIVNAHDIQLIAKKNVQVVPPGPAYTGALMGIVSSTNITLRGFTFDGNASLGSGAVAVGYLASSGKILKNTFNHWVGPDTVRAVVAGGSSPLPLRVTKNRFSDYSGVAIDLYGETEPLINNNRLDSTTDFAIGIRTTGQNGGRIVGNRLSNVSFPVYNGAGGIYLTTSNNVLIARNRLTHFNTAIGIETSCTSGYGFTSDSNRVIGNRITESALPIYLAASTLGDTCAVQANNNQIVKNRMIDVAAKGVYGILVQTTASTGSAHADNLVVKKNYIKHFNGSSPSLVATGAGASFPTGVLAPNKVLP